MHVGESCVGFVSGSGVAAIRAAVGTVSMRPAVAAWKLGVWVVIRSIVLVASVPVGTIVGVVAVVAVSVVRGSLILDYELC